METCERNKGIPRPGLEMDPDQTSHSSLPLFTPPWPLLGNPLPPGALLCCRGSLNPSLKPLVLLRSNTLDSLTPPLTPLSIITHAFMHLHILSDLSSTFSGPF